MPNNLTLEHPNKTVNSSDDITQITDNFNQLCLKDNKFLNCFGGIVKELYNLYNEERLKCKDSDSIINTLDQFLVKKKQNPDNIINWCLDNQINPMAQIILAGCYRFGKWVEKDER